MPLDEVDVFPSVPDIEASVLSSMMLGSTYADIAVTELTEDEFYTTAHHRIFLACRRLHLSGRPCDIVLVAEALRVDGVLQAIGGTPYLSQVASAATVNDLGPYITTLKEYQARRKIIMLSSQMRAMAEDMEVESEELIAKVQSEALGITTASRTGAVLSLGEMMSGVFEEIEAYSKGSIAGIKTGLAKLDTATGGLQRGDLVIVAGRPSMGKTAFALNVGLNIAMTGLPVVVFSLEMARNLLCMRMLCDRAGVSMSTVRAGRLPKREYPKLSMVATPLAEAPLYVDDSPTIRPVDVLTRSRQVARKAGQLGLVIVDYLQLMKPNERQESRQLEVSAISRDLKAVARELACPVMALSQLSRGVEQRGGDKRPILADLRDSGAIEQDADVVMLLYRAEYYFPDDVSAKGKGEVNVAKQRNGPTGTEEYEFNKETMTWHDLTYDTTPAEQQPAVVHWTDQ